LDDDTTIYLPLVFQGNENLTGTLEFRRHKADLDGLWIRTSLVTPAFGAQCEWFLASEMQQRVKEVANEAAYGRAIRVVVIRDTDCSFAVTFSSLGIDAQVDVVIEISHFLENGTAAIVLYVDHAMAALSDVHAVLRRLSDVT
jgi:hypothetical protein